MRDRDPIRRAPGRRAALLAGALAAAAGGWAQERPADRTESCVGGGCHADVITYRVMHGPVVLGNCTGCHNPHGSDYRSMLVDDPVRGLCVRCHHEAEAGALPRLPH